MKWKRPAPKRREKHLKSKIVYRFPLLVTRFVWLLVFIYFLCITQKGWVQDFELSASNQLEFSLDQKNHDDIFHNWFDFNWSYDIYNLGLGYEAHQPDDWGETFQDLSFRYFRLSPEFIELTIGNYYAMLGRGLILRSYENRDLRQDNNLDGVKGKVDLDGYELTLLWGTPRGKYERVNNPLFGAEVRIPPSDWMSLGGDYLRTDIADFGFIQLYAGNLAFHLSNLDFYGEYAKKDNPSGEFKDQDGHGFYLSSNVYTTGFGLTLEYKDYQRLDFTHGEVTYNNPPSLTREHAYTLLNRQAYELNLYDEKGFQIQGVSTPCQNLSLLANYSYTTDHEDEFVFSEIYAEAEYEYEDLGIIKTGFSRMENKKVAGFPEYFAPVFDLTYYLSEQNSIAFLLEHMWASKYDGDITYYDQIISLTFSHSPFFSLTLTHERTTEWETRAWSGKKSWFVVTLDAALTELHNLSLSTGTRRAGKVCSGGVCTDRPALDGLEIKLLSQF